MRNVIFIISLWFLLAAAASPQAGDGTGDTEILVDIFQREGLQRFVGLTLHDLLGAIDIPLREIWIHRGREHYYSLSLLFPSRSPVTIYFEARSRCPEIEKRLYQDSAFAEVFFASAKIKSIQWSDRSPNMPMLIQVGGMLGIGGPLHGLVR